MKNNNLISDELKNKVLSEAINIGNELLNDVESDTKGNSWKTISTDENFNASLVNAESLYSGTAGIALFLLELYNHTKDAEYLKVSLKAIDWLERSQNKPPSFHSFFAGRLGISYLMLRAHEITMDESYKKKAVEYTKNNIYYAEESPVCDLLNGIAGILLGLLIIYSKTFDTSLLKHIDNCIKILLKNVHISNGGIYWDRMKDAVCGLCGFSHGASGIGYVFLELGRFFNNPSFYWIAQQAFAYENALFNKKFNNWPDLRKLKTTSKFFDEHEKAYLNNDKNYFTFHSDMNSWCHGAAGIGLSRIRARQLINNNSNLKDLKRALSKTIETDIILKGFRGSVILCHGRTGNAEIFIENYLNTGRKKYLTYACQVAEDTLESKRVMNGYSSGYFYESTKGMEDNSLFMGKAGVGYFFLRLLEPNKTPSVLMPKINSKNRNNNLNKYEYINLKPQSFPEMLVCKVYQRTYTVMSKLAPKKVNNFMLKNKREDLSYLIKEFAKNVKNIHLGLKNNNSATMLKDAFKYETTLFKYDKSIDSNAWFDMKKIQLSLKVKQLTELSNNDFEDIILEFDKDAILVKSFYDWVSPLELNSITNSKRSNFYYVFKKTSQGVKEFAVPSTVYFILKQFERPMKVRELFSQLFLCFNNANPDKIDNDNIKSTIAEFVRRFINLQILVEYNNN